MAIAIHVARVRPMSVSPVGTVINKNTATTAEMLTVSTEMRVVADAGIPNTANNPTIETYLAAEAASGYEVKYFDQSFIITYPAGAGDTSGYVTSSAGASLQVKYAPIDAATSGDNTIVAAVASKKIRVLSAFLVNGHTAAQTVRFESGASGTALTGQMVLPANGGFVLPHNPHGWFETTAGALLNLELAGATTVDGAISYIEV